MKRILITAALFAAGLATSLADIKVTFPPGYSFCAPPLESVAGSPLNDAETILPALESGDMIWTWNGSGFDVDLYVGPGFWIDGNTFNLIPVPTLAMGSGFLYVNGSGSPEVNVYPGFALGGTAPGGARNLANGYTLIGSFIPNPPYPLPSAPPPVLPVDATTLSPVPADSPFLSLPLVTGDQIIQWSGSGLSSSLYLGPDWIDGNTFDPISPPLIYPAEGFFYQNNSGSPVLWVQPP